MRGDKPPRQKRGNQRRLAGVLVFADMGVEPSPLFEWRIFGTFVSGQKYGRIITHPWLIYADIKKKETAARKPRNSLLNIEIFCRFCINKSTEECEHNIIDFSTKI